MSRIEADRLAKATAAHGFSSRLELPDAPVSDTVFANFLAVAEYGRLLGTAAQLAAQGRLAVTDDQMRSLTDVHNGWLHHDLIIERLLLRIGDSFAAAGIEMRVLKGAAYAHLLYDNPSWRVFGDLDLLVPSDQFDDAVRMALTEFGGSQPIPELRPGFDHEFGKEALIEIDGIEVDLHRTFVTGPFGLTIDLDRLFDSGTALDIGGRRFLALDATSMFLHTCYNLALGDHPIRLCSARDLLVAAERLDVDGDDIVEMARAWRASAVVRRAAESAIDSLDLDADATPLLARLACLEPPRSESWLLRSYLTTARSYTRPLAAFAVIGGVRPRLRYARALLAPSAEYLRSRGWTERSHVRRARERLLRRG